MSGIKIQHVFIKKIKFQNYSNFVDICATLHNYEMRIEKFLHTSHHPTASLLPTTSSTSTSYFSKLPNKPYKNIFNYDKHEQKDNIYIGKQSPPILAPSSPPSPISSNIVSFKPKPN